MPWRPGPVSIRIPRLAGQLGKVEEVLQRGVVAARRGGSGRGQAWAPAPGAMSCERLVTLSQLATTFASPPITRSRSQKPSDVDHEVAAGAGIGDHEVEVVDAADRHARAGRRCGRLRSARPLAAPGWRRTRPPRRSPSGGLRGCRSGRPGRGRRRRRSSRGRGRRPRWRRRGARAPAGCGQRQATWPRPACGAAVSLSEWW